MTKTALIPGAEQAPGKTAGWLHLQSVSSKTDKKKQGQDHRQRVKNRRGLEWTRPLSEQPSDMTMHGLCALLLLARRSRTTGLPDPSVIGPGPWPGHAQSVPTGCVRLVPETTQVRTQEALPSLAPALHSSPPLTLRRVRGATPTAPGWGVAGRNQNRAWTLLLGC